MKESERSEKLLEKAIECGRRRNYSEAVSLLTRITQTTDSLPQAYLYLGRARHAMGRPDEAVLSLRMYISRRPACDAGHFYLGRSYIALGEFRRASVCFEEAVRLNSGFAPARAYLGFSLLRCGDIDAALENLGHAVELDPENSAIYTLYSNTLLFSSVKAFRAEDFDRALAGFLFLDDAGMGSITTKLYSGIILKEKGDFTAALGYIEEAASLAPDDEIVIQIYAELLIRCGEIENALKLLSGMFSQQEIENFIEKIEDIEEQIAENFFNKKDYPSAFHFAVAALKKRKTASMHCLAGHCLLNTGRYADAGNHFDRARSLDPEAAEPLYGKIASLWLQNEYEAVLKLSASLLRMNSEDDFALYYSILCRACAGHPQEEWKAEAEGYIRKNGNDSWLQTAIADSYIESGEAEKAEKLYRKTVKAFPDHKQAWEGLLGNVTDHGRLLKDLKRYIAVFPDDRKRTRDYAVLLSEAEDFKAAIPLFRGLLASGGPNKSLLRRLAYCCRRQGDYQEAAMLYRQLLQQDPDNETMLRSLAFCLDKSGRISEAVPLLRSAVEYMKNPSLDLLLTLGVILYREGHPEESEKIFRKCILDGKTDWRVYRNLGIINKARGLDDYADMFLRKSAELKKQET